MCFLREFVDIHTNERADNTLTTSYHHPNRRDARSSVRTNEQPNRMRSLTYVDKHDKLSNHRLFFACGRTNVRRYGLSEDSCRPRTQRTYKYHANVHPLQGVTPCGLPQAVMIHNLLVGCRNLRSSLEEAHSSVTPDKTSGTSAVWGYEIAQSISLEEVG